MIINVGDIIKNKRTGRSYTVKYVDGDKVIFDLGLGLESPAVQIGKVAKCDGNTNKKEMEI